MEASQTLTHAEPRHRIGAVARLAGVPVTTLRAWESRYAAFAPQKSAGGHRLYADADVIKARLMRQLSASGHGVGEIAVLPLQHLQQLWGRARADQGDPQARPVPRVRAVVVGQALAARVDGPEWQHRYLGQQLDVQHVYASLQEACVADARGPLDVLLVRLHALTLASHRQLMEAVAVLDPLRVIVLYGYGADRLLSQLRAGGMIVRREPVPQADLGQLIASVVLMDVAGTAAGAATGALIPPRRFSETALARIAATPSNMLCECPRHIAELVTQLASFEQYSHECLNTSSEDARVHGYLRSVAGSARAMFEEALQLVARHDGMVLRPDLSPD